MAIPKKAKTLKLFLQIIGGVGKISIKKFSKEKYDSINDEILNGAVKAAKEGFGGDMTREEVLEHILPTDLTCIAFVDDKVVGFGSLKYEENCTTLSGAVVSEKYQGEGIYKFLTNERIKECLKYGPSSKIEEESLKQIKTRTQNPKIEIGIKKILKTFEKRNKISDFTFSRELKKSEYGRMLTEERPLSRNEELNKIYNELCYERGDAFLLTFNINRSFK